MLRGGVCHGDDAFDALDWFSIGTLTVQTARKSEECARDSESSLRTL